MNRHALPGPAVLTPQNHSGQCAMADVYLERTDYRTEGKMSSVNVTNARKDLYKLVQKVNLTHEPVEITGKDSNAILVGEDDWKSIQETLYLTSIPGMRESIIEGMNTPIDELSDTLDW